MHYELLRNIIVKYRQRNLWCFRIPQSSRKYNPLRSSNFSNYFISRQSFRNQLQSLFKMGVPKFFRYISERYPCLSELVKETQIPEFDNLYLDMNGIIHNCSHPDDDNVHFRITEEQIFTDVFHYIDTLFRMIQPRKLFFMAVDGVAPRAKMNQQRGRRFRSAKEAETKENLARQKGETLPDTVRFDSNCITPGTAFMVRLQDGLKQFVQSKISSNPLWRKCRVILSGHETPGEGEHKIMEYIRYLKASPGFDPNTRHCLYGLDADLVMLGLCSHELHFSLLREEVKFGNKAKKSSSVDSTRFFLLHLGLMREYLELEFIDVKERLPFAYDMDSIVDDWILMCYLVGNDFIPNLPNFHINTNALPTLYASYKKVLPQMGGYINEAGVLNLKRLEIFLAELGEVDREMFKQKNGNLECLRVDNDETFGEFALDAVAGGEDGDLNANDELRALAQNTLDMYLGPDDDENEGTVEEREFFIHKRDYYTKKMGYAEMTPEVLAEQAECYVRALQWTLYYYYRGVKSWCWYYPHHYAPYISDVRNFAHLKFDFEQGTPFLPFQQLLAVLPAASRAHLPSAYHELMTSVDSRVIDYYPANFETDLNGKKQDWEAVVLIPFIDERRLLEAMAECQHLLTGDEVARNAHGPMYQYDYCERDQGPRPEAAAFGLTDCQRTYCVETSVHRIELQVPEHQLVLGTSPGVLRDVYFAGFPTFKHHPYSGAVKSVRAKVFDMPSNNPSMVVKLLNVPALDGERDAEPNDEDDDRKDNNAEVGRSVGLPQLQALAHELIGSTIYVGWPHLGEAKVLSVCDYNNEITRTSAASEAKHDSRRFETQVRSLASHYKTRMGIDIGATRVLVCAQPLREMKYQFGEAGRMQLTKVWSDVRVNYALQTIVRNVRMHTAEAAEHTHVRDVFPVGSTVFMASNNLYYGSRGTVLDVSAVESTGRIGVELHDAPAPDFGAAQRMENQTTTRYMSTHQAAAAIGMHHAVFSQITGTCLITLGAPRFPLPDNTPRCNIGLQLKFPKRAEELVGFSKRFGNSFMYSQRAVDLVAAYAARWLQVVLAIRKRGGGGGNDAQFETDVFASDSQEKLHDVQAWLKQQSHASAERRACGARALEEDTMREVVAAIQRLDDAALPVKTVKLRVMPNCLYKPGLGNEKTAPDAAAVYELFDRVVVVKETHSVPLGYRGTVVGIHSVIDPNPVRQENQRRAEMFYDVLFDRPFDDGGNMIGVTEKRMFKMSPLHLLNITYGSSKYKNANASKGAAAAQFSPASSSSQSDAGNLSEHSSSDIWAMLKKANEQPADAKAYLALEPPQQKPMSVMKREKPQQGHKTPSQRLPAAEVATGSTPQNAEQAAFEQLMEQMKISASLVATGSVPQQPQQPLPLPVASNREQYQQIKLEDMFRVDATNLPKPPVNWRQKMVPENGVLPQQSTNGATDMHRHQHAPPSTSNNYHQQSIVGAPQFVRGPPPFVSHQPLLPQPQRVPVRNQQPMQQQQPPYAGAQRTFYPQPAAPAMVGQRLGRPQGPQNLRQNGHYPPGQGAFIPLQATRKQAAAVAAAKAPVATAHQHKPSGEKQQQRRRDGGPSKSSASAAAGVVGVANVAASPKNDGARARFVPPAPKPSRIAACFDVKP